MKVIFDFYFLSTSSIFVGGLLSSLVKIRLHTENQLHRLSGSALKVPGWWMASYHGGSLDTDKFMRAMLQYRNTPMQDCRKLPAQMVFGRQMRDFIPSLTYKYEPAKDWAMTQEHRERTLANKRDMDNQRWSHRTKTLDDLEDGTVVAIQNQTGSNLTKWDKTGIVIENKPNSKVMIRVDGSRRVTMRNRRFVRPMEPMLRNSRRPEPARRRTALPPPIRQELQRKNPPSRPPVQVEHVDEAPAEVRGGVPDVPSRKSKTLRMSTTMLMFDLYMRCPLTTCRHTNGAAFTIIPIPICGWGLLLHRREQLPGAW
jgi:hypothetical protein